MVVGEYYNACKLLACENEDEMKKNNISLKKNNVLPMVVGEYYNACKFFALENEDEMKRTIFRWKGTILEYFELAEIKIRSHRKRVFAHFIPKRLSPALH